MWSDRAPLFEFPLKEEDSNVIEDTVDDSILRECVFSNEFDSKVIDSRFEKPLSVNSGKSAYAPEVKIRTSALRGISSIVGYSCSDT